MCGWRSREATGICDTKGTTAAHPAEISQTKGRRIPLPAPRAHAGSCHRSFYTGLGTAGGIFLALAVTLFAFSTVLGGSYYGIKAREFLFGAKSLIVNQLIFIAAIPMSCLMDASLAIDLSDTLWPSPTSSAC